MTTTAEPRKRTETGNKAPTKRVAIYIRQSVTKDGDPEFGSPQAQREAIEAYVLSQRERGWELLPEVYEDLNLSGATTDRPALQRLLDDIDEGRVEVVATYKFDRLSRSLADFTQLMNKFQAKGVSFVSITQSWDTGTSAGRLMVNMLMAFAEFEREQIADRIRDKVHAARKRGLWTGGTPPLGYDAIDRRLVVNKKEARLVREIFRLYLKCGSVLALADELRHRGSTNKSWMTKGGRPAGGEPFTKTVLLRILRDPLYIGRMKLRKETFVGAHRAIVKRDLFGEVQVILARNGNGKRPKAMKYDCLLQGLVRCAVCDRAMGHHSTGRGNKRYSAYVCQTMQKQGASACPGSRVPLHKLESFVVGQIHALGRDEALVAETVAATRKGLKARGPAIQSELKDLAGERRVLAEQQAHLVNAVAGGANGTSGVLERLRETEARLAEIDAQADALRREIEKLKSHALDEDDLRLALASFTPIWTELFPAEQRRIVQLLVAEVRFNGPADTIQIAFRADGIQALAAETKEAAT